MSIPLPENLKSWLGSRNFHHAWPRDHIGDLLPWQTIQAKMSPRLKLILARIKKTGAQCLPGNKGGSQKWRFEIK